MGSRSLVAATVFAALPLLVAAGVLAAQEDPTCKDRAGLRVAILDETGTLPVPGAEVRVRWVDVVRRPVRRGAGDDGHLTVCAPRDATRATVWAEEGDGSSEQASVDLTPGETREIELRILSGTTNPGRLVGRVFDARTKDPITTAAVTMAGRRAAVESDRWGRFILTGVRAGSNELEVRHLGYAPLRYTIDVEPGLTTQVDLGLVPDPVEMEPLVATTTWSPRLESKGFYERRYWGEMLGTGEFITRDYLERWRPLRMSQLLSQHTMLRPRLARGGRTPRTFGECLQIYLDNMNVDGLPIDTLVYPMEVAGIEVYRAPASLPDGLLRFESRCSLVLIWTG
ncbi:carboxypeptidase regulatory-like domain-containing protein [Candidatus Palauibacter sp.]|uniref:carboxypeptidase regulatory-like domain-containing protein n=1 Tax=Candidatus Palauibacter sp. TaxID=3101350 RepID=UPI003B02A252